MFRVSYVPFGGDMSPPQRPWSLALFRWGLQITAVMHDNWMVSVAAVCRARMDILRAELVFQAACEHKAVMREQPGAGAGAVGLVAA